MGGGRALGLLLAVLLLPAAAEAEEIVIKLKTQSGEFKIPAVEKREGVWVDVLKVAEAYDARTLISSDVYRMDFSSYSAAIEARTSTLGLRGRGRKGWKVAYLDKPVLFSYGNLMVNLESLPDILGRSFSYRLQARVLEETNPAGEARAGFRSVPARWRAENQKIWISLEDVEKALNAVGLAAQSIQYKIVLPDFTILELRVGQARVFRRGEAFRQLEDPLLLFSGSPYVTLGSIKTIFGVEAQWDAANKTLWLAQARKGLEEESASRIKFIGYRPEPWQAQVENYSVYYQDPSPSFAADPDQVYESVRDFLTNEPIRDPKPFFGKVSGTVLPSLRGSLGGAPLEARGLFEKIGTESRLVDGSARWGFPTLQLEGGREYLNLAGLDSQFSPVDQVSLSHSGASDEDGSGRPVRMKAFYGQTGFSIFMSSSLFSQTVDYRQNIEGASLEGTWKPAAGRRLSLGLEQYFFQNEQKGISKELQQQDLFADLFGDGADLAVTEQDRAGLTQRFLSDRHAASVLDLDYQANPALQFTGNLAASYFRDDLAGAWKSDADWKVRAIAGPLARRLDASYEHIGPDYRSIGNPTLYEGKRVLRLAPGLDLTKTWKAFAEYRREDSSLLTTDPAIPYTNTYFALGNVLALRENSLRASLTDFQSTFFGGLRTLSAGALHYFGRDTLDLTGTWTVQTLAGEIPFKDAYGGKISYQVLKQDWRFSLAQQLTRNNYGSYGRAGWESLTSGLLQWKTVKALAQYELKPKYFLEDDVLHTLYLRLSQRVRDRKSLSLFFAVASKNADLSGPEVYRIGLEWANDVY